MTAAALASRIFMGESLDSAKVRGGAALVKASPPAWEPGTGNDFYYWYYGALAMFQIGGDHWRAWNAGILSAIARTQRRGGDEDGSWDPCDAWGIAGGRVYATAINCLTREVYYRYGKVLAAKR